jgi:hypothetical protein
MLGKTIVFLNHTPYEKFWEPLTLAFCDYPHQVLDLNDHWERTGDFDVFSRLDPGDPAFFIAHAQGAYFLLNYRLKRQNHPFQSCLIEPDDFCFTEGLIEKLRFLKSLEKVEFVDYLEQFYKQTSLPSRRLGELLASFDGQENFMKAQLSEISRMIEDQGQEIIRALRDASFLLFHSDYGQDSQELMERLEAQPFTRLSQAKSVILRDSDYLPFYGSGLEPILGSVVEYLSA